jgi:hypothetical protein
MPCLIYDYMLLAGRIGKENMELRSQLAQITATIEAWTEQARLKSDADAPQTPQVETKGQGHGPVDTAKAAIDRQEGFIDFRTQDILLRMSSLEQRMERVLDIVENSIARANQV